MDNSRILGDVQVLFGSARYLLQRCLSQPQTQRPLWNWGGSEWSQQCRLRCGVLAFKKHWNETGQTSRPLSQLLCWWSFLAQEGIRLVETLKKTRIYEILRNDSIIYLWRPGQYTTVLHQCLQFLRSVIRN